MPIIVFFILTTYACNNQQNTKENGGDIKIKKQPSEKSIIKKVDISELNKIKGREILVTEILTTSPRYIQFTKGLNNAVVRNGGQSLGLSLEGSPDKGSNNKGSYSTTFDFVLYEKYTDRQLNIARFSFNPIDNKLYEYDAIKDQQNSIEFDRSLLLKYEALCE